MATQYSYYPLAFGGFMVCVNGEPIWEVETEEQAQQDCEEMEVEE